MAFWKNRETGGAAPDTADTTNTDETTNVTVPEKTVTLSTDPSTTVPQSLSEIVIQHLREGVVIINENLNITLANPAAEELTGHSFDDMQGLNYDSILKFFDKTGQAISDVHNPILRAFDQGNFVEQRDLDLMSAIGKSTPVSVMAVPIDGKKSAMVVTLRDIAQELEEERERSEFISTASHEMRTPVASIEGYLGLAMNPQTATIDDRCKQYLQKAHEASQHLGKLFQDLLDTTKMDDHRLAARFEPVEIVRLAKQISDEQIPAITAKGLGYQFGSGAGTNDAQISGGRRIEQVIYASIDRSLLKEVLDNLIENAIKYTPEGWVTVTVRADQHNVQIVVEDTGVGIPREEIEHVFQKFYRVDNRDTREIGGTGLGLYLVKQKVEIMNGRIWAESEVGKGSRFIVMLPRLSPQDYRQQKFLFDNQAGGRSAI